MSETPSAENAIRETRGTHTIEAECLRCGCDGLWPNKGLGRATFAAWRTRHGDNCHVLPPGKPQP